MTTEIRHPFDEMLRSRLRAAAVHQAQFARAIGRSPGWLNKYMNGEGTASVDDAIRIAALLIGLEAPALSDQERKLLRVFRSIESEERRDDAVEVLGTVAKRYRREPRPESGATLTRTDAHAGRKARSRPKTMGDTGR